MKEKVTLLQILTALSFSWGVTSYASMTSFSEKRDSQESHLARTFNQDRVFHKSQTPQPKLRGSERKTPSFDLQLMGGSDASGGDEVALEFQRSFSVAINKLSKQKSELFKTISISKLFEKASEAKVVIVDDVLDVKLKDIIQNSVATNTKSTNTILITRSRWNSIKQEWLKEGIALHEILSLAGVEQTGYYPISSRYVALYGGSLAALDKNLTVNTLKQVAALNPKASPRDTLNKFFNESIVPATLEDFDWNGDQASTQECQVIGHEQAPESLVKGYLRRAQVIVKPSVPAMPDRGPLFPEHPELPPEKETRIVYTFLPTNFENLSNGDADFLKNWDRVASEITSTNNELIEKISGKGVHSGIEFEYETIIRARKNGALVAFSLEMKSLTPDIEFSSNPMLGYCYRR